MSAKAIIIGHVGSVKSTVLPNSETLKVELSIATTTRKTKATEDAQTNWHSVVFWNKQAKVIQTYVEKGDMIQIEGHIEYETWTDKEGNIRTKTIILGSDFDLIGRTVRGDKKETAPTPTEKSKGKTSSKSTAMPTSQTTEDDIPF